jgi:methyl-accepting chemotaxis protein
MLSTEKISGGLIFMSGSSKNMTIKRRLTLILTVTMIAIIAIVTFVRVVSLSNDLDRNISTRLRDTGGLADQLFDTVRLFIEQQLLALADMPQIHDALRGGDPRPAVDIFRAVYENINVEVDGILAYPSILLFDSDFYLVAEATPSSLVNARTTPYQENLRMAELGYAHISDVNISPATGLTQFWFTQPIMINNNFAGMLAMPANTIAMGYYLFAAMDEYDAYVTIADINGVIFFSTHPEYVGRNITEAGLDSAFSTEELFRHTSELTGIEKMAWMSFDEAAGWYVLAFFSRDDVYNVAWQIFVTLAPTVGMMIVAMIGFMFIVSTSLKPLGNLATAAKDVARGNMNVNFDTTKGDEIGQVSRAFAEIISSLNIMIDSFRKAAYAHQHGDILYKPKDDRLEGAFAESFELVGGMIHEYILTFDHLSEPIMYVDKEFKVLYANNILQEYAQKSLEEALGMHANDLLNFDIAGHPSTRAAQAEAKAQESAEIQVPFNADKPYDMEYGVAPFSYADEVVCYLMMFTDITRIKEMQRVTDKRAKYLAERSKYLNDALISAFEDGNLNISVEDMTFDEDTQGIATEQKAAQAVVKRATDTIKGYVDEITATLQEIAGNNFDVNIHGDFIGDFGSIKDSVKAITESVSSLVSEIQAASAQVEIGAEQISQSTQQLMANFQEQSAAMSETREAVDSLTVKTQKNAEDARAADRLSSEVREAAAAGTEHMAGMTSTMEEIRQSSNEIAKIVGIIDSIAFQTNLLALNASVEAARAGEHGRGFAVVAEEVRNLAGRSATATQDTAEMLEKSLARVDEGVTRSEQTAAALANIVESIAGVVDVVANIAAASKEQADEIGRIHGTMEAIYKGNENNASSVQNNASVSEELSSQATMLRDLVGQIRIKR